MPVAIDVLYHVGVTRPDEEQQLLPEIEFFFLKIHSISRYPTNTARSTLMHVKAMFVVVCLGLFLCMPQCRSEGLVPVGQIRYD
jgi:hypothetical protein